MHHWRRQLWGTGARAPLDFQLVIWGSLALQTLTSHAHAFLSSRAFSGHRFCRLSLDYGSALPTITLGAVPRSQSTTRIIFFERTDTENVHKQRDFYAIFGRFCIFLAHSFPQGLITVPKMPERSPINFNSTRTSDCGKTGC